MVQLQEVHEKLLEMNRLRNHINQLINQKAHPQKITMCISQLCELRKQTGRDIKECSYSTIQRPLHRRMTKDYQNLKVECKYLEQQSETIFQKQLQEWENYSSSESELEGEKDLKKLQVEILNLQKMQQEMSMEILNSSFEHGKIENPLQTKLLCQTQKQRSKLCYGFSMGMGVIGGIVGVLGGPQTIALGMGLGVMIGNKVGQQFGSYQIDQASKFKF